jgi:hypothetical protein
MEKESANIRQFYLNHNRFLHFCKKITGCVKSCQNIAVPLRKILK